MDKCNQLTPLSFKGLKTPFKFIGGVGENNRLVLWAICVGVFASSLVCHIVCGLWIFTWFLTRTFSYDMIQHAIFNMRSKPRSSQLIYRATSTTNYTDTSNKINVAESISSDIFTTGSRINALTAHAQTLLSCLKQVALNDSEFGSLERYLVLRTLP